MPNVTGRRRVARHAAAADRHAGSPQNRLLAQFRIMSRIRAFEVTAEAAARAGEIHGMMHAAIGQEAVAVGVCAALQRHDVIASAHRNHHHALAKGVPVDALMAELFGREAGSCGGKGGSMHIADFSVGMLGANGVVGASVAIAIGAAQGARLCGMDRAIAVAFFGDGGMNRGQVLEGLNYAAVYGLPVLFVCEDNQWAATTRTAAVSAGPGPAHRAEALGVPAETVDGNDVAAVEAATAHLVDAVRAGNGPRFLLARTYRLRGHVALDPAAYRDSGEVEARRRHDPIERCRTCLRGMGVPDDVLAAIDEEEEEGVRQAVRKARAASFPSAEAAFTDVQTVGAPSWPPF